MGEALDPVRAGLILGAAVAAAVVGTHVARRLAPLLRAVDVPNGRSSHAAPTPRTGGLGVAAGVAVALLLDAALGGAAPGLAHAGGASLFLLVGLLDDMGLVRRAGTKFALQVACAAAAVAAGLRFEGRAFGPWGAADFGAWTPVVTVVWIVGLVNVVNFNDGIDGMASATAAVVFGAAAGAAEGGSAAFPLACGGAVLGYAVWNAPPARVFLGDGGSHLLGFLLAASACGALGGDGGWVVHGSPWALVCAPLLPAVIEAAAGILGKLRRRLPLTEPHRDHLYQRLVRAGRSHGAVALRYGGICALGAWLAGPGAAAWGWAAACATGAVVLAANYLAGHAASAHLPWTRPTNGT